MVAVQKGSETILKCLLKVYSDIIYEESKSKTLPWNGLHLKSVEDIFDELFKEISKRTEKVDLSKNQLNECPKFWSKKARFEWHKLRKLDLSGNKLNSINKELFRMELLETLLLENNQLKEIPDVEVSISLKCLNLNDNQLRTLPKSFKESMISSLYIAKNEFDYVPECVCYMRRLKYLQLNGNNRIVEFPLEMGNMDISTTIEYKGINVSVNLKILEVFKNPVKFISRIFILALITFIFV